ncbi:hypothetical protein HOLleu_39239 [Holothuria leucospilota]|uniref:Reverse transcriptase n=1 Tax=Holothuria leucospilota TaxID=206669 RepID=A0A9Q1BBM6_HOLLE|nr:hypothetical protein HOLleu_39239 [Holothuria leucospilota]
MALIGKIGEFDSSCEDFDSYSERLSQFFIANDVANEKKVSVFLSVVGAKTYGLLKSLLTPDKPSDKTYNELIQTLKGHLTPKPLVIAERFKFHRRNQNEGETISAYAAELKRLSTHCEFGNFLQDALRDRFVCGIKNLSTQRKLLSEAGLTFSKALEKALASEMAEKNAQEFKGHDVNVNRVSKARRAKGPHSFGNKTTNGQNTQQQPTSSSSSCYRCGETGHIAKDCKYKGYKCNNCGKVGHLAKVCRSKHKSSNRPTNFVDTDTDDYTNAGPVEDPQDSLGLYTVTSKGRNPFNVTVTIDGKPLEMEVDTGASMTIIPEEVYQKQFGHVPLQSTSLQFKTYSGEKLDVMGEGSVTVQYCQQKASLPLIVAKVKGQPPVLGRNWLEVLKLDWNSIFKMSSSQFQNANSELDKILKEHSELFSKELGTLTKFKAKIQVREGSAPKFHKARSVPYAQREAVGVELDRLEHEGIISKVDYSDWAAPIVIVRKTDDTIRICGDYKVTINPCIDVTQYPLPNPQDIYASLAGGTVFSKLDLSQAYQQMLVDEDSRKYLTINTQKGLYQYNRLAFGVASAPAIFQSVMDQILQGIDGVMCYLDDILITGMNTEQHLERLRLVLNRLKDHGLRLKASKCKFLQGSLLYLGHVIDREGIRPYPEKVHDIMEAPSPSDIGELRSFLGMVQYYAKFLPNLSTTLHPLNDLLKVTSKWNWSKECEAAFQKAKECITSAKVLMHYDVKLPIKLACDASSYGLGAVISHVTSDGQERPVAFASRTLSASEKNYSQIEKEVLALIFGVKKFHQYLYGRKFTLVTDHKPLLKILGPKSGIPTLAAARLQRWALLLASYQYEIEFRKTEEHSNADALSRLPVARTSDMHEEPAIYQVSQVNDLPVSSKDVEDTTRKDPILSRALQYTLNGWPEYVQDDSLKPFFNRKEQLSVDQGCLLWGLRVIIPPKLQSHVLNTLHDEHVGICRMKALARSYFWWPGLDKDIENIANNCEVCVSTRNKPPMAPLHPWRWPSKPWERIHIDFAEKPQGQYFKVVVDAHSKWPEVFPMSSITTSKTIAILRNLFASYGLPDTVVSDNGPQFISKEFSDFMQNNKIKHIRVAPYHPASNGAAERFVQVLKQSLKAGQGKSPLTLHHRIANFLLSYRSTPHSTTNRSPAELFLRRQIKTKLSLLRPNLASQVEGKQESQKQAHDQGRTKVHSFEPGENVMVKNFRGADKWVPGVVMQRLGPLTYIVLVNGKNQHVHIDHLITGISNSNRDKQVPLPEYLTPEGPPPVTESNEPDTLPQESNDSLPPPPPQVNPESTTVDTPRTYPKRDHRPPRYLSDYVCN